jgi:superfamily I DNA/RNA helicase
MTFRPASEKKRERQRRIRAYEAAWARLQHEEPGFAQAAADAAFQNVLVAWLRFHEGMLIGEIIPELYRYLRNNPAAPERSLYDHVLVDEYQDLNRAEQAVVDLLSTSAALCVVAGNLLAIVETVTSQRAPGRWMDTGDVLARSQRVDRG